MGIALVEEVLNHAPAELTSGERVVLLVLAQNANDATREGWPGMERIAHRAGLSTRGVACAFKLLRERGLEVRVQLGVDQKGRPVFAHRGTQTKYRIPHFAQRALPWTDSPLSLNHSAAIEPESPNHNAAFGDESLNPGSPKDVESPNHSSGSEGESLNHSVGKPEAQFSPSLHISSDKELKQKQSQPFTPQHPEPLRTIVASLDVTSPGATEDEARAIHGLIIEQHHPQSVAYFTRIANSGGFGAHLATVRDRRRRETERLLPELRRTEPPCEHDEPAGRSLHPVHKTPLCPRCRTGAPAAPSGDHPETDPQVAAVITAYGEGVTSVDGPFETRLMMLVTAQATALIAQGVPYEDLALVAKSAGAEGVDLATFLAAFTSRPVEGTLA